MFRGRKKPDDIVVRYNIIPAQAPEPAVEVPDIEVARYALRTFKTDKGTLRSLYKSTTWDGGVMVAECLAQRREFMGSRPEIYPGPKAHEPPGDDCTCGLYGTLSLQQLVEEYGNQARRSVAVIAAEGLTVIGTKGLRTSAARVVAFWHPANAPHSTWAAYEQCADAKAYADMAEMLEVYHFDPYPEFFAEGEEPWREYKPPERRRMGARPLYPTVNTGAVTLSAAELAHTCSLDRDGRCVWANCPKGDASWANVSSLMAAATPEGMRVVKNLLTGNGTT